MGIIDNLTGYNFNKKVANFCKSFLWDEKTLSTVEAKFYQERFEASMTKKILGENITVTTREQQYKKLEEKMEAQNTEAPVSKAKSSPSISAENKSSSTNSTNTKKTESNQNENQGS